MEYLDIYFLTNSKSTTVHFLSLRVIFLLN